jgi:hypothetical protein
MNEEIQEIDKLTKQTGDLADSLIRYARKLQERSQYELDPNQHRSERFAELLQKLMDLGACSGILAQEMEKECARYQRQAYVKARVAVMSGTSTPQEAVIELLRASVADKTMSPDSAAEQLVKLLRTDLRASRKIEIREKAKAAFEAGEDVVKKVKTFLRTDQCSAEQTSNSKKRTISQRT